VHIDGAAVRSCQLPVSTAEGRRILTIEGLGSADALHPMQKAIVRHDGYQCGYCTPGQICSAVGMLDEVAKGWPSHVTDDLSAPALDDAEISERMSGNICRCSAYPNIVDAIRDVHAQEQEA
jgi:xanthine dehydrogenase YagT iron-sulfur-binding subunit